MAQRDEEQQQDILAIGSDRLRSGVQLRPKEGPQDKPLEAAVRVQTKFARANRFLQSERVRAAPRRQLYSVWAESVAQELQ